MAEPPMAPISETRPFEVSTADFRGKTIIQRTSAGTQGIVAESRSERLYAVSLVTAEATVRALLSDSPDQISLYILDEVAERPRQCIEFPKTIKVPARAYVSADEALVDQPEPPMSGR